jgi:hypothetical protein
MFSAPPFPRALFGTRRRPIRIVEVLLRVPARGLPGGGTWEGPMTEAQAQSLLVELRRQPRPGWPSHLWMWLALEDGTDVLVAPEWDPRRLPDLRRMAGASLARMAESSVLPAPACEEAHRVLELLEGQGLPCLRDHAPTHLRAALADLHPPAAGPTGRAACRRCGLLVGGGTRTPRHFLPDGTLCGPRAGAARAWSSRSVPLADRPLDGVAAA